MHFLQIWIEPERAGLAPGYEQKSFAAEERRGTLRLVASRDARDGSLAIHRDADVYAALLDEGQSVAHALRAGRSAWLQVARGALDLNGHALEAGDGAGVREEARLEIRARSAETELLLFDLDRS